MVKTMQVQNLKKT